MTTAQVNGVNNNLNNGSIAINGGIGGSPSHPGMNKCSSNNPLHLPSIVASASAYSNNNTTEGSEGGGGGGGRADGS